MRRVIVTAATVVFALGLMGAPTASAHSGKHRPDLTSQVIIRNQGFHPQTVHIGVGDSVQWTDEQHQHHTTTSDTGVWDSGSLGHGDSFTFTFTKGGKFKYHCRIHPHMTGTIVVKSG